MLLPEETELRVVVELPLEELRKLLLFSGETELRVVEVELLLEVPRELLLLSGETELRVVVVELPLEEPLALLFSCTAELRVVWLL